MKNLFYSKPEKVVFWISGTDIQSANCNEIIVYLQRMLKKASDIMLNCPKCTTSIGTFVVQESKQYKGMRVFFADKKTPPKNAYEIEKTMEEWLNG